MDNLTKEKRSWNMSRIGGKNTKPEIVVRSILHRCGFRFRIHRKDLPGKPDIVLPKHKAVIFVHGCFWHRHEGCKFAYNPKSRLSFWHEKFATTIERDREHVRRLNEMGWRVEVIWECELKDEEKLRERLVKFLA